ncbi:Transposase IS3/IS911 [sediment metagenome]|uniref:Transposase IS3/IS911 n=1 Tax=sediment metagenome TaxID=749907 RepID=D9PHH4_9ZZZZ
MQKGISPKSYPKEFKQTAIELALCNSEKPMTVLANELGIHQKTLYSWVLNYKKSNNLIDVSNKPSQEEELKRLKKENARLKMECDILKKATAYFAKETM